MKPLISIQELRSLMPRLSPAQAREYAPLLCEAMFEFEIISKKRRCAFLSNIAEESAQLTRWTESLGYSAHRMTQVWPKRFPSIASAAPYAMNPQALAEKVYGGRMGNTRPGDGYKYRGRFPLQATGREMYSKLARALRVPALLSDPDLCLTDRLIGFRVSAWIFAVEKDCNRLADKLRMDGSSHDRAVLTQICERINGGHTGLAERINYFRIAKQVLHNDVDETEPSSPQSPVAPPVARPAEPVNEQESADSQAESPAIVSAEPDAGLLGAAVSSPKAKAAGLKLWPRIVKHSGAGLTFIYGLIEANKIASILVLFVIAAGIGWLIYHNRKKLAPHVLKWLQ